MINKERWLLAQQEERKYHNCDIDEGVSIYGRGYREYLFKYMDIDYGNLGGRSVLEIGPADFPALYFCENFDGYVIEPMDSPILKELAEQKGIVIIKGPAEEVPFPFVDEVWMFNVLTHVMSPDAIISKAKTYAPVIRFFEPINTEISIDHPWSLSMDYYKKKFGYHVMYYPQNDKIQGFHAHECAYGVWRSPNV